MRQSLAAPSCDGQNGLYSNHMEEKRKKESSSPLQYLTLLTVARAENLCYLFQSSHVKNTCCELKSNLSWNQNCKKSVLPTQTETEVPKKSDQIRISFGSHLSPILAPPSCPNFLPGTFSLQGHGERGNKFHAKVHSAKENSNSEPCGSRRKCDIMMHIINVIIPSLLKQTADSYRFQWSVDQSFVTKRKISQRQRSRLQHLDKNINCKILLN